MGITFHIDAPPLQCLHQGRYGAFGHTPAADNMKGPMAKGCHRSQEPGGRAVIAEINILIRRENVAGSPMDLPASGIIIIDPDPHGA